jgi:fatty acid desaturase
MTRAKDLLSRDEIRALVRRSDLRGGWAIVSTWAIIGSALAVLAAFPNPLTFLAAVIVIGGRQLGLVVLMHEAAHRTLFENRFGNDLLTDWLCARPMWSDIARYRAHHHRHHSRTNTPEDPDLSLVTPYPTTRRSLARKLARDAIGVTGAKRLVGLLLIDLGFYAYTVSGDAIRRPPSPALEHLREGLRRLPGVALSNAALFAICALAGHGWVYAAWVVAYLTVFSVVLRIRSLAEHACTELGDDPLRNTRTTRAGPLARLLVAPFGVNFHLEHHLLVSVPYHRLAAMHRLLRERGAIGPAPSYTDVLTSVSSRGAS